MQMNSITLSLVISKLGDLYLEDDKNETFNCDYCCRYDSINVTGM